MATTIQLPVDLKQELDALKKNAKDSYADVLRALIKNEKKRETALLIKEYGQKYGKQNLKEVNEWSCEDWDETR
ncbi:MAG: hypothetical protein ACMXYK_04115 [Candidatus Woesearchaeota archaeon]